MQNIRTRYANRRAKIKTNRMKKPLLYVTDKFCINSLRSYNRPLRNTFLILPYANGDGAQSFILIASYCVNSIEKLWGECFEKMVVENYINHWSYANQKHS